MQKTILVALTGLVSSSIFAAETGQSTVGDIAKLTPEAHAALEARATAARKRLGGALKTELMAALKSGGPVAALAVCNDAAPSIAASVAEETGLSIGRTALKVRNPDNAPDTWMRNILEDFTAQLNEGANPAELSAWQVKEGENGAVYRSMAPIMTGPPCTLCHGQTLSKDLSDQISTLYPSDQATGFKVGDLRGAFWVEIADLDHNAQN